MTQFHMSVTNGIKLTDRRMDEQEKERFAFTANNDNDKIGLYR